MGAQSKPAELKTNSHDGTTWVGVGAKGGFTAVLAGLEDAEGLVFNLANPMSVFAFGTTAFRAGLGLGISGGFTAIIVLNCDNPLKIDGQWSSDWGVDLAIVAKVDGVFDFLRNGSKFMKTLANNADNWNKTGKFTVQGIENLRNGAHEIYTARDAYSKAGGATPEILIFDIPFGGAGVEAAVTYKWSRARFYHYSPSSTSKEFTRDELQKGKPVVGALDPQGRLYGSQGYYRGHFTGGKMPY